MLVPGAAQPLCFVLERYTTAVDLEVLIDNNSVVSAAVQPLWLVLERYTTAVDLEVVIEKSDIVLERYTTAFFLFEMLIVFSRISKAKLRQRKNGLPKKGQWMVKKLKKKDPAAEDIEDLASWESVDSSDGEVRGPRGSATKKKTAKKKMMLSKEEKEELRKWNNPMWVCAVVLCGSLRRSLGRLRNRNMALQH